MAIRVKKIVCRSDDPNCDPEGQRRLTSLATNLDSFQWEQVGDLFQSLDEAVVFLNEYADEQTRAEAQRMEASGVKHGCVQLGGQVVAVNTSEGELWKVLICKNPGV
jgi:hypothetical protein